MIRQTVKSKKNITLHLAAVLLCLTLFSVYLTSGLFARYTAQDSGNDSARVAGFHPTATIEPADQTIKYDIDTESYTINYTIAVANPSEVAVKYDVVISFNDATLNGAVFQFDDKAEQTINTSQSSTFNNVGVLSANETTPQNHTLTFTVTRNLIEKLVAAAPDSTLDLKTYFTATVDFTQLD